MDGDGLADRLHELSMLRSQMADCCEDVADGIDELIELDPDEPPEELVEIRDRHREQIEDHAMVSDLCYQLARRFERDQWTYDDIRAVNQIAGL